MINIIEVMKYIERLLSYNDRFYKHTLSRDTYTIYCPLSLKIISEIMGKLVLERRLMNNSVEAILKGASMDEQVKEEAKDTDTPTEKKQEQGWLPQGVLSQNINHKDLFTITKVLFENDFHLLHIIE